MRIWYNISKYKESFELKSSWDEWRDYEISRQKLVHEVLELCCFEWFQNENKELKSEVGVLELCCFEWFQNP